MSVKLWDRLLHCHIAKSRHRDDRFEDDLVGDPGFPPPPPELMLGI